MILPTGYSFCKNIELKELTCFVSRDEVNSDNPLQTFIYNCNTQQNLNSVVANWILFWVQNIGTNMKIQIVNLGWK